jgi:hypothetical protein
MDPAGNWEQQYNQGIGQQIAAVVVAGQITATRKSDEYIAAAINELSLGPGGAVTADALIPNGFAGWAGDGRPVETLLGLAPVIAGRSFNQQRRAAELAAGNGLTITVPSGEQALADAEAWLDMVSQTIIADTARAAEAASMAKRPWLDGWVRMVVPPCCSRCAVLAGKFYLFNAGFDRHPNCKCLHIPAPEADYSDLTVNPNLLFESMSAAEQDRTFTKAGAEAIRHGADMSQVVNARLGMHTAQHNLRGWIPKGRLERMDVFGRGVFITTEGVTKHGVGRKAMGVGRPVRLMPESIFELAESRDESIRLLRLYGYITD